MKHSQGPTQPGKTQSGKSTLKRRAVLGGLIAGLAGTAAAAVTGLLGSSTNRGAPIILAATPPAGESKRVTLYKDPQCGCCEGYADYLRGHGFDVSVVPTHDLPLLNDKYGIPTDLQPCHISLIGSYVIGGHVPIEIVNRLLSEKPAISGVTLPGMPLGSPGMNGQKTEPFKIYEISKGSRKIYAAV